MNKIISFIIVYAIVLGTGIISQFVMQSSTYLLTGQEDFSHWGYSVIMIGISLKIMIIVSNSISLTTVDKDE